MMTRNWAAATDEEIFEHEVVTWTDEDHDAYKKERAKRLEQKRMEQERTEQERTERLDAIKEAVRYSDAIAQEICERISACGLLTIICRENDMPTMRRCQQWLKEHADFQALFNMSIQDSLFVFEEQVVEIADDIKNDFRTVIKNGKEKRVAAPDMVARSKIKNPSSFSPSAFRKPGSGATCQPSSPSLKILWTALI